MLDVDALGCEEQKLVVAGDPERSYLLTKISSDAPACGARMPLDAHLPEGQIQCLRAWVSQLTSGGSGGQVNSQGGANAGQPPTGGQVNGQGGANAGQPPTGGSSQVGGTAGAGGPIAGSGGDVGPNQGGHSGSSPGGQNSGGDPSSSAGSAAAGSPSEPEDCGAVVSFAGDVQPIFTASCAKQGCHTNQRPSAGLSLASGTSYQALVGVMSSCAGRVQVRPGNPAESYLMDKLLGTNMCSGSQMPKAGGLASGQLDTVRRWICQGALNN